MKTNKELYAIAKAQIGNGGAEFRKYVGIGKGEPYCDAFAYWLFNANGCGELLPWKGLQRSYCPSSIQWCNKNLALIPPYLAMQCDIIYFDWEKNGTPNHIGIVTAKKDTVTIYTLEGNTTGKIKGKAVSGIVFEKTRTTAYVQGVYRPHFKGSFKIGKIDEDGNFEYNSIANLQVALKMSFHDAIMGKATVKAWQTKIGLKGKQVDGAWGRQTSLYAQRFLIKQGCLAKGGDDGDWGKQSTIALQKWINKQNNATTSTTAKASTPTASKQATSKPAAAATKYTGTFPDLIVHSGQKISETAKKLAYPKGTPKASYTYDKGKKGYGNATIAFTRAINRVFPKRSTWSKQCQAGASCDVGAATVIRASGIDTKVPRGLQEQIPYLAKSNRFKKVDVTQAKDMKPGDVGLYTGNGSHIWIGVGNKLIAEANHHEPGYYLHIDTDNPKKKSYPTWAVYRACIQSAICLGDTGTEVLKLQKFLNWFNPAYKLEEDSDCGTKTEAAIKDYQKRMGLTEDGQFGSASLAKAKTCSPCVSVAKVTQSSKPIIDVSYWQHNIDWKKAAPEISGAILRSSYTSQSSFTLARDSTYQTNLDGATRNGVKVGVYHYSQAISVEEAKKEAEYVCRILNPQKGKISLPVVIDWEFGGRLSSKKAKSLGRIKCTEIIEAFCEAVSGYGFTPMVYANYSTFASYLDYNRLKNKYLIWLAQYASKASISYDYWQYTSSGKISGIKGNVDLNKAVK